MFRLINTLFDDVAGRLADNFCDNLEEVEKNREAQQLPLSCKAAPQHALKAKKEPTLWVLVA